MAPETSEPNNGAPKTKKSCKCGSYEHSKTNHKSCPLRKGNVQNANGEPRTPIVRADSPVAAVFKHAEWTFHGEVDEYDLEWQEESIEEMLDNRLKLHVSEVMDNCNAFLQNLHGHEYDQKSRLKVFFGVGEDSLAIMRKWVSKEANKRKLAQVTECEFLQWVALNIAIDLINLPLTECLSMITLLQNTRNFPAITPTMTLDRYKALTQCVRAIDPDSATNTRHSWGGVIDNVANMREFESAAFGPSRKICMTPNAIIVVDDELVSCRSKTVQSRIISQRKRGKDGLKNDSIACSITRILLGVRHKQRIAYKQLEQVKELLNELAQSISLNGVLLCCDRGYGVIELWLLCASLCMGFVMYARGGKTTGFPFTMQSEVNKKAKKKQQRKDAATSIRPETPIVNYIQVDAAENPTISEGNDVHVEQGVQVAPVEGGSENEDEDEDEDGNAIEKVPSRALHLSDLVDECDGSDDEGNGNGNKETLVDLDVESPDVEVDPAPPDDQEPVLPAFRANGIVDDSPLLGKQILAATTNVASSRTNDANLQEVMAITFRDYNNATNSESNVVKLVLSNTGRDLNYFRQTLALVKTSMKRGASKCNDILFFPVVSKSQGVKSMEAFLLERTVPLTCWQKCVDWFTLRMFMVTGTMGHKLANQDMDTRRMLHKDPLFGWAHLDKWDNETCAKYLRSSWVFPRGLATVDMKSGSMNESAVLKFISSQSWCKNVYECGMFGSIKVRCMGASPDGICVVTPPGSEEHVTAAVEIKTRFAPHMITSAKACVAKHAAQGTNFVSCTVGDDVWWDAVPFENRAQVIQQAAVLDLNHVLFCVAAGSPGARGHLLMACLVRVTNDQREQYAASIESWSHLMNWAHDSVLTTGPPPQPNKAFTELDSYILSTHIRFWRALRKKVANGPIHPVYIVKSAAQLLYNKCKGGLDGSTQYVRTLTGQAKAEIPTEIDQKIAIRTLKQVVVNSAVLWRLQQVKLKGEVWSTLSQLRQRCNAVEPLNKFALELCIELLTYLSTGKLDGIQGTTGDLDDTQGMQNDPESSQLTQVELHRAVETLKRQRGSILAQCNKGIHKRMRLSKNFSHNWRALGKRTVKTVKDGQETVASYPIQKVCVVCGGLATNECSICKVPLHTTRLNGGKAANPCFSRWHNNQRIDLNP